MAAAYALHALEADEMEAVEQHLRTCETCRTAVAEMRSILAVLPYAVEPIEPPPSLKEKLFERIHAQSPAPVRAEPDAGAPVQPARRSGFWSLFTGGRLPLLASTASLLLALGLGAFALQQRNRAEDYERQLAQYRAINQITTNYQARVAQMAEDGMQAKVYMVPNHSQAYVVIAGLPELPKGRDYQIWLKPRGESSQPVSVGVFRDNTGKWLLRADRPLTSYEWIGITQEPDGGSPRPTSQPLMGGNLQ